MEDRQDPEAKSNLFKIQKIGNNFLGSEITLPLWSFPGNSFILAGRGFPSVEEPDPNGKLPYFLGKNLHSPEKMCWICNGM